MTDMDKLVGQRVIPLGRASDGTGRPFTINDDGELVVVTSGGGGGTEDGALETTAQAILAALLDGPATESTLLAVQTLLGIGATTLLKVAGGTPAAGDAGIVGLGIRQDVPTGLGEAATKYVRATFDAYGAMWVSLASLISGEDEVNNILNVVAGRAVLLRTEQTRPANTTAYTANDAIGNTINWAFANAVRAAGWSGTILSAIIATDDLTNVPALELDLYSDTITDIADNAEATQLYVNSAKRLGTIYFPALAKRTANSTTSIAEVAVGKGITCVGTTLYGVLRTPTAIAVPVSGAKYSVTLVTARD